MNKYWMHIRNFKDGNTNPSLNDYEYDLNGNMILDRNKGITEITYNYLNLPEKITFSNNDYIVYTYNAAGQKLSKYISMVNTNNTIKTVEYLDGFQYTGGQLNFFPHAEGFVDVTLDINSQRVFNYVFNYTDHLGNIRMSYTKDMVSNELKIMEETHYYPFGLKHEVYTSPVVLTHKATPEPDIARPGYALRTDYQYKYNGKEFQDELGLNMYAMDMRQYDPAIARWVVHDPIVHHSMSPYNAFDGNPVFWADPSGGEVYTPAQHEWNQKFENSIYDGNNGIDAFSAFNGNFWQFHPFDKKSGATEANGNQNRETDPPGNRAAQITHSFKYDDKGRTKGTDTVMESVISINQTTDSKGNNITRTTWEMTKAEINKKGSIVNISKTVSISQTGKEAFVHSDFIKLEQTSSEFQDIVNSVSEYKINNYGVSPIQAIARQNEEQNGTAYIIGATLGIVGTGLRTIPHPFAKGAGYVLQGTGAGIKFYYNDVVNKTDPEKIRMHTTIK